MFIVGVAGGSGSGKTTFAEKIIQRANDPRVGILHHDSYYQERPPASLNGNFDHPDAFDWPLLQTQLEDLRAGKSVEVPVYDYHVSARSSEVRPMDPPAVLVVEGIFTLWAEETRALMDLKVYLDVDADIRFIRRLHRDVSERGRNLDGIIKQYYDTVRPMHRKYLEPTKQFADIIVGDETDIAANAVAAQIKEVLHRS